MAKLRKKYTVRFSYVPSAQTDEAGQVIIERPCYTQKAGRNIFKEINQRAFDNGYKIIFARVQKPVGYRGRVEIINPEPTGVTFKGKEVEKKKCFKCKSQIYHHIEKDLDLDPNGETHMCGKHISASKQIKISDDWSSLKIVEIGF